jgi:hypothetical protein
MGLNAATLLKDTTHQFNWEFCNGDFLYNRKECLLSFIKVAAIKSYSSTPQQNSKKVALALVYLFNFVAPSACREKRIWLFCHISDCREKRLKTLTAGLFPTPQL